MINEKAPPGREDQVKALKKKFGKKSAYAIAWASYNKSQRNKDVKKVDESNVFQASQTPEVKKATHVTVDGAKRKVLSVDPKKGYQTSQGWHAPHEIEKVHKTGAQKAAEVSKTMDKHNDHRAAQKRADQVASAMEKLRTHLKQKGFKSVKEGEDPRGPEYEKGVAKARHDLKMRALRAQDPARKARQTQADKWHEKSANIKPANYDDNVIKKTVKDILADPKKQREISSGKVQEGLGLNAFHKFDQKGYDHSAQDHTYHGKSSTGAHVTSDGGRDTEKAAEHIRRGFLSMKKSNRDKFKNHLTHVDSTEHTDTFRDKSGVHYDAHHDPETNTVHVTRTKSRIGEEVIEEDHIGADELINRIKGNIDLKTHVTHIHKKLKALEKQGHKFGAKGYTTGDDDYRRSGSDSPTLVTTSHKDGKTKHLEISKHHMIHEDSAAPTNAMGDSASDPDAGNVQGFSPLMGTGNPKKRKELEDMIKLLMKGKGK